MEKVKGFLKKKDIVFSVKRYGIDALGAMAQGLFCTLLIGTILNTLGNQFGVPFLKAVVATVNGTDYTVGGLASAMAGPAMAVARIVLTDNSWICGKCLGRRRRPAGSLFYCSYCN